MSKDLQLCRKFKIDNPFNQVQSATGKYLTVTEISEFLESHRSKPIINGDTKHGIDSIDLNNLLKYYGNYYEPDNPKPENALLKFHPLHK